MIEFVCTPLPVSIAQQGCHGNHAFSHSPNEFMFRNIFSHSGMGGGGLKSFFGTNEKLSWGCEVGQIRFCDIGYPISVQTREITHPLEIPLRIAFLCTSRFF